jgi:hypothetical protein
MRMREERMRKEDERIRRIKRKRQENGGEWRKDERGRRRQE